MALEDPKVRQALPRYIKLVKDELPAKFMIAKRIEVKFDPNASEEELWGSHSTALEKFTETQQKIDQGKLKFKDLETPKQSLLDLKVELTKKLIRHCELCSRLCRVNRLKGEKGFCRAGIEWKIFGAHPHYGEEAELVPSGTIFQSACSMRCIYCQNAPESISPELGTSWTEEEVAEWIEKMKGIGVRNINWVGGDPTPWLFNILQALKLTDASLPQVWNSNSYYSKKTSELIKGIVDVYLLDFRYFNEECAIKLSSAPGYPEVARRNHLTANRSGELLIRVLLIPSHLECDAKPILQWIRENLGAETRVNILAQFWPAYKSSTITEINRRLSIEEWKMVIKYAKGIGLKNLVREIT